MGIIRGDRRNIAETYSPSLSLVPRRSPGNESISYTIPMSNLILVNIRESFLNAAGFWESNLSEKTGNWCKFVESIDKTRSDGYSIEGNFVSQFTQLKYQQPGLYLHCQKKGGKKGQQKRLYTLFVLQPHGEVEVITELQNSSKDWAVQVWPEIEAYFAKQSNSVEQRRQQIMVKIESLESELSQLKAELIALDFQESN